jgi:E3 ubiquitin-protein ligase SIAH1
VGEETRVVERIVAVVVVNKNCMAFGNLKMDIPESPMKEEGDTPSNTKESKVESKNPLLTLGRKTSFVVAHTGSVHELLECPICTNSMYPPIHQVPNLLFSL